MLDIGLRMLIDSMAPGLIAEVLQVTFEGIRQLGGRVLLFSSSRASRIVTNYMSVCVLLVLFFLLFCHGHALNLLFFYPDSIQGLGWKQWRRRRRRGFWQRVCVCSKFV